MKMTKKQEAAFNKKYEEVKTLSRIGEIGDGTSRVTSLYDWMQAGYWETMTAKEIAIEWDDLNEEDE